MVGWTNPKIFFETSRENFSNDTGSHNQHGLSTSNCWVTQTNLNTSTCSLFLFSVHVRRTDKVGTEAAFHGIEEYMAEVDEYYDQLELKQNVEKRRIYLASDDPKVLTDARNKYPHYEILGDSSISKTAAVSSRYSDPSLNGIIIDIHMLSMSDFLVCTFSSQVSSDFLFFYCCVNVFVIGM